MKKIVELTIAAGRGNWMSFSVIKKQLVDTHQLEDSPTGERLLHVALSHMVMGGSIKTREFEGRPYFA